MKQNREKVLSPSASPGLSPSAPTSNPLDGSSTLNENALAHIRWQPAQ